MRIENKIVADFYARLFPWIDHTQDVRLCQDDGGSGPVAIPDLCFYFIGSTKEFRIEFKTWYKDRGGHVGCTEKQGRTWRTPTAPGPHFWIAGEQGRSSLYTCWPNDEPTFQARFQAATLAQNTYRVQVPKPGLSLADTYIQLMTYARAQGMLV